MFVAPATCFVEMGTQCAHLGRSVLLHLDSESFQAQLVCRSISASRRTTGVSVSSEIGRVLEGLNSSVRWIHHFPKNRLIGYSKLMPKGLRNDIFHNCSQDCAKTIDDKSQADNISGSRFDLPTAITNKLPLALLGIAIWLSLRPGSSFAATSEQKDIGISIATDAGKRGAEILASAWTGLVAGCLHTLTGPDHLAALAPLCIGRSKLESAVVGALWGCGHDAGQMLFGIMFLLLKDRLHIELIRTWGARVVGLTLIAIGVVGIKEAQEVPVLASANHGVDPAKNEIVQAGKKSLGLTFATGIVYGLQPDALLMILPALALPSKLAGIAFLGMFLLGTIIAMGSYTVFLGSCSEALQQRVPWITQKLTFGSSFVAIGFGLAVCLTEFFGISIF